MRFHRIFLAFCLAAMALAGAASGLEHAGTLDERLGAMAQRFQRQGMTPLTGFSALCAVGTADEVRRGLEEGVDLGAGDPAYGGIPPLAIAAGQNPDPAVIDVLLEAGAEINFAGRRYKRTALHMAVLFNPDAAQVVAALIRGGAVYELEDNEGVTALGYAIRGKQEGRKNFSGVPNDEVVAAMVAAMADFPRMSADKRTLFYAFQLTEYLTAFERLGDGASPSIAVMAAFQKAGADFNVIAGQSKAGTALGICVGGRNPELVKFLLDAGANPNLANRNGETPILFAAMANDVTMIRLLMDAGAWVKTENADGDGVLHYAVRGAELARVAELEKTFQALIGAGVAPNAVNKNGDSMLYAFCKWTEVKNAGVAVVFLPVFRGMVAKGVNPELRNKNGATPLFGVAASRNSPTQKVRIMKELGCDIDARDNQGATALMQVAQAYSRFVGKGNAPRNAAEEKNYLDGLTALLQAGADPGIKDNKGKQAVDYLSNAARNALVDTAAGKQLFGEG